MSDLFTIDCHACGAKNTIDTETMRRVTVVGPHNTGEVWVPPFPFSVVSPEPAGDSDWPDPESAA